MASTGHPATNRDVRSALRKEKESKEMIKISIEVSSGLARFRVSVMAECIERALDIAQTLNPGKECKVIFPIDAEGFIVKEESLPRMEALGMVAA
jgi:hypothetical protein